MRSRPVSTGLIVVDLPPEEDDELCLPAAKPRAQLHPPGDTDDRRKRLPAVLRNTSGFLYYVSITGITGTAAPDVNAVHTQVGVIKSETKPSRRRRIWHQDA